MDRVCSVLKMMVTVAYATIAVAVGTSSALAQSPLTEPPKTEALLGGEFVDLSTTSVALIVARKAGFLCSGLLVGPQEVLTAGHCIDAPADDYLIVVGGERYAASSVTANREYDNQAPVSLASIRYDLGMIQLDRPVTSAAVTPILTNLSLKQGDPAGIYGYGSNEASGDVTSSVFDQGKFARVIIEDNSLGVIATSAAVSGASTCPGDSGGALLQNVGGYLVASGVISSGTNNADKAGYCIPSRTGVSLYVDVQSQASRAFLAQFPGVQYLSGRNVFFLSGVNKLATRLGSTGARAGAKELARAFQKLRQLADARRGVLLSVVVRSLTRASMESSRSRASAAVRRAAKAIADLQALGVA